MFHDVLLMLILFLSFSHMEDNCRLTENICAIIVARLDNRRRYNDEVALNGLNHG